MACLWNDPLWRYKRLFSINIRSKYDNRKSPLTELMREHFERTLGISIPVKEWKLSLRMDDAAIDKVLQSLHEKLPCGEASHYIHINLEARTAFRELGIENCLEVSKSLVQAYPDLSVVWTSSPAAAAGIEKFLASFPSHGVYFQPTRNIQDVIGVVRGAELVISPDTSVVHIASAEGKPVVGLYTYPNEWPPYQVPNKVLWPKKGQPVSTIPISKVMDAVRSLMGPPTHSTYSATTIFI